MDNRVITLDKKIKKDLVLLSLDEYNASLPEEEKILSYDFYKLNSDFAVDSFQNEEEIETEKFEDLTYLPEPTGDFMSEKENEIEEEENVVNEEKFKIHIFIGIVFVCIIILLLFYLYVKKKKVYKE